MRQGTYLNVILTINAILLTAILWAHVADRPMLSDQAHAQSHTVAPLNAGAQRQKIIELLKQTKKEAEASRRLFESGNAKVQVTNLHEIRVEAINTKP